MIPRFCIWRAGRDSNPRPFGSQCVKDDSTRPFDCFLLRLALFCRSVQTEFSVYSSLSIFVLFLKWSKLWSNLILTEKTYYCSHSQENKTSTTKGEITMKNVLKSIRNGIFANYLPTDPIELIAFTARNLILFVAAYVVIRLIF